MALSAGCALPILVTGEMTSTPLLSVCIPTYNRADLVVDLVRNILAVPGAFEICVHDDGSKDETNARLRAFGDERLHVTSAANQGRAGALIAAFRAATGKFIMPFDDDDTLSPEGLERVLQDCAAELPHGCVGHIYHLSDAEGRRIGSEFPVVRSNFVALRADHAVTGDKKEVVLASALRAVMYDSKGMFRRTPTSLFWSRLALDYDVLCHNVIIGTKDYLAGGMSQQIRRLKRQSAYPQFLLKVAVLRGFAHGRYRSARFAWRALLGGCLYGSLSLVDKAQRAWRRHA